MDITKEEYEKAVKIVDAYRIQERSKKEEKQKNCPHKNLESEVSEWHQNGQPDRWRTYCKDCSKVISD